MSDNFYYYVIAKKAALKTMLGKTGVGDENFFYLNSGLEKIYSGALLLSGSIDALAMSIPVNWNIRLQFLMFFSSVYYSLRLSMSTRQCALKRHPSIALFVFHLNMGAYVKGNTIRSVLL